MNRRWTLLAVVVLLLVLCGQASAWHCGSPCFTSYCSVSYCTPCCYAPCYPVSFCYAAPCHVACSAVPAGKLVAAGIIVSVSADGALTDTSATVAGKATKQHDKVPIFVSELVDADGKEVDVVVKGKVGGADATKTVKAKAGDVVQVKLEGKK